MSYTIRAKVEQWVTMSVDNDDLDEAYKEVENAIKAESANIEWDQPNVTDVEFVGHIDYSSYDDDSLYEERRDTLHDRIA